MIKLHNLATLGKATSIITELLHSGKSIHYSRIAKKKRSKKHQTNPSLQYIPQCQDFNPNPAKDKKNGWKRSVLLSGKNMSDDLLNILREYKEVRFFVMFFFINT